MASLNASNWIESGERSNVGKDTPVHLYLEQTCFIILDEVPQQSEFFAGRISILYKSRS